VQASSQFLFPPLVAIYSCILGIFVPSGGDPRSEGADSVGYTFTMFLVCFPAALIVVTLLASHVAG
jgi:short-chain fatty acids transporter